MKSLHGKYPVIVTIRHGGEFHLRSQKLHVIEFKVLTFAGLLSEEPHTESQELHQPVNSSLKYGSLLSCLTLFIESHLRVCRSNLQVQNSQK